MRFWVFWTTFVKAITNLEMTFFLHLYSLKVNQVYNTTLLLLLYDSWPDINEVINCIDDYLSLVIFSDEIKVWIEIELVLSVKSSRIIMLVFFYVNQITKYIQKCSAKLTEARQHLWTKVRCRRLNSFIMYYSFCRWNKYVWKE